MNDKGNWRHRSIRLKDYDYTQAGAYFITICTNEKKCILGKIADNKMELSKIGVTADKCWVEIPDHFQNVVLDAFVVMPNHIHGIIVIKDVSDRRNTACRVPTTERFGKPVVGSLPTIIRSYKSAVTKKVNELYETPGLTIWQKNYYEHVVRNDEDMNDIREYIIYNPLKWELDKLYSHTF